MINNNVEKYSYLGLAGISDSRKRMDVLDSFQNELDEHLRELGIELF